VRFKVNFLPLKLIFVGVFLEMLAAVVFKQKRGFGLQLWSQEFVHKHFLKHLYTFLLILCHRIRAIVQLRLRQLQKSHRFHMNSV